MLRKSKKKKLIFIIGTNVIVLLFLILSSMFFARVSYGVYLKYSNSKKHEKILENQYKNLLAQKQELEDRINKINSNFGKESILREDFNLAKEGEKMIMVFDDYKENEFDVQSKMKAQKGFLDYFKNLFEF